MFYYQELMQVIFQLYYISALSENEKSFSFALTFSMDIIEKIWRYLFWG